LGGLGPIFLDFPHNSKELTDKSKKKIENPISFKNVGKSMVLGGFSLIFWGYFGHLSTHQKFQ
jgi:hypothetical protein